MNIAPIDLDKDPHEEANKIIARLGFLRPRSYQIKYRQLMNVEEFAHRYVVHSTVVVHASMCIWE